MLALVGWGVLLGDCGGGQTSIKIKGTGEAKKEVGGGGREVLLSTCDEDRNECKNLLKFGTASLNQVDSGA